MDKDSVDKAGKNTRIMMETRSGPEEDIGTNGERIRRGFVKRVKTGRMRWEQIQGQ